MIELIDASSVSLFDIHCYQCFNSLTFIVSGEWQTVRNKEQRAQRKEKKRQDETATTLPKPNPIITHIPPVTSLPSTAKGR